MNEGTISLLDSFDLREKSYKEKMCTAVHLYDKKQYEFARQIIEHSVTTHTTDSHAHFLLGLTLLNLNRTDEAEESFIHVIKSSPDCTLAHVQLSLILFSREENDKAIHHMSQAIDLTEPEIPAKGRRIFLRGIMRLISGDRSGLDDLWRANDLGWDCSEVIDVFENNDCEDCFKDDL